MVYRISICNTYIDLLPIKELKIKKSFSNALPVITRSYFFIEKKVNVLRLQSNLKMVNSRSARFNESLFRSSEILPVFLRPTQILRLTQI